MTDEVTVKVADLESMLNFFAASSEFYQEPERITIWARLKAKIAFRNFDVSGRG